MKIEILLATMFFEKEEKDYLKNMNIETDIIVGNQCDRNFDEEFYHGENKVRVISTTDRGVGKNRNLLLDNATADILLLADNDVKYYDGYKEKILNFYTQNPDADLVIFNFKESRGGEPLHDLNLETKKAKLKDATKFGAFVVSAKRESIKKADLSFSLLFGGGAVYGSGEDSIFIADCFKKKLNVYLCGETLGEVNHRDSTWFSGVTEKYVFDKGALFRAMCPKLFRLAIIRHIIKHKRLYSSVGKPCKVYKLMIKGARDYKTRLKGSK